MSYSLGKTRFAVHVNNKAHVNMNGDDVQIPRRHYQGFLMRTFDYMNVSRFRSNYLAIIQAISLRALRGVTGGFIPLNVRQI